MMGLKVPGFAAIGVVLMVLMTSCTSVVPGDQQKATATTVASHPASRPKQIPVAPPAPTTFTLIGELLLKSGALTESPTFDDMNGKTCHGDGGFREITGGLEVTVYDAAGTVVALGQLYGGGQFLYDNVSNLNHPLGSCHFKFAIPGVPTGQKFYQVEIGHRSKLAVTAADAIAGRFAAQLG